MFEFNFDDAQEISQVVVGVKGSKITGLFIQHPDGHWDEVVERPKG